MQWIQKKPPIYIWDGDTWFNETDGHIYGADVDALLWRDVKDNKITIPFPPKTRVMKEKKNV